MKYLWGQAQITESMENETIGKVETTVLTWD